jgi:hypothetical protein
VVIQSPIPYAPGAHPVPVGYLYGYVDTRVPGMRAYTGPAGDAVVAPGVYRLDALIPAINAYHYAPVLDRWGVRLELEEADAIEWRDRLGWVLGYGAARTYPSPPASTMWHAPYCSPAAIPLLSATWDQVDIDRDRWLTDDAYRHLRAWVTDPGARIWQCELSTDRAGASALETGHILRGRASVVCGVDDPISPADPGGSITGRVVGADVRYDGQSDETASVTIWLAQPAAVA